MVGGWPQARQTLSSSEPEIPGSVAESRDHLAMRQSVGRREVFDATSRQIQTIHAVDGTGVNAAGIILHQAADAIARQSTGGIERPHLNLRAARMLNHCKTAVCAYP